MLLPNSLPIWISDGDDLLNNLEQMLYLDDVELTAPSSWFQIGRHNWGEGTYGIIFELYTLFYQSSIYKILVLALTT